MSDHPSFLEPTIEVLWPGADTALVILGGEHDLSTAPDLSHILEQSLGGCAHLIVDISSTQFVDSSTIAALAATKRHADGAGKRFNLVLASTPIVERALDITGVLLTLNRVMTLEEALAA
jgi:anti-anti-sigma factor